VACCWHLVQITSRSNLFTVEISGSVVPSSSVFTGCSKVYAQTHKRGRSQNSVTRGTNEGVWDSQRRSKTPVKPEGEAPRSQRQHTKLRLEMAKKL